MSHTDPTQSSEHEGPHSRTSRRRFLRTATAAAGLALPVAIAGCEPVGAKGATFNVRDHGATGNGTTDDTAAVQKAIDAAVASPTGGTIVVPSGRYRITRSLRIRGAKPLDFTGSGSSSELLWAFDGHLLLWDSDCRECSVRDLKISAYAPLSPGSAAIRCSQSMERSTFSNLLVFGGEFALGSGITAGGVSDTSTIENCVFWGITGVGVGPGPGSEIRIIGGRVTSNHRGIGIHLTGGTGGVHVIGTDLINLRHGMLIERTSTAVNREVFITHATFDGCFRGLAVMDGTYVSVAGCWAASCDHENIYVDFGSPLLVINGGTIFNGGINEKTDPQGGNGLTVNSGSFVLNGVAVRENRGRGIWVPNDAVSDYSVSGCRITNNGIGVSLEGSRYICSNNVVVGNSSNHTGGSNRIVAGNVGF